MVDPAEAVGDAVGTPPTTSAPAAAPASLDRGSWPLSGVFAIQKPPGPTCMSLLDRLKPLLTASPLFAPPPPAGGEQQQQQRRKKKRKPWDRHIKLGQGGTLDPLAQGVLVVGVNGGTKRLGGYQSGERKSYTAVGLLGCETDSYDAKGGRVALREWRHVTEERLREECGRRVGEGTQVPPIYSALKMDGKPLYEYARENLPLPRPIEARPAHIYSLSLVRWLPGGAGGHGYTWPRSWAPEELRQAAGRIKQMVQDSLTAAAGAGAGGSGGAGERPKEKRAREEDMQEGEEPDAKKGKTGGVAEKSDAEPVTAEPSAEAQGQTEARTEQEDEQSEEEDGGLAPAFEVEMTVSSGTYVRSIIHDAAASVGSAAHVVKLVRTRQAEFGLHDDPDSADPASRGPGCVLWELLEAALQELEAARKGAKSKQAPAYVDRGRELQPWELEILRRFSQNEPGS